MKFEDIKLLILSDNKETIEVLRWEKIEDLRGEKIDREEANQKAISSINKMFDAIDLKFKLKSDDFKAISSDMLLTNKPFHKHKSTDVQKKITNIQSICIVHPKQNEAVDDINVRTESSINFFLKLF